MMHQKAKLNHKILTRIRYFSYGISLACIMLLLSAFTNLAFYNNMAFAAERCSDSDVPGYKWNQDAYNDPNSGSYHSCTYLPILTTPENITIVTGSTTPTASLSIDGKASVEDKINSSYGTTNYASHTVSVNVTGAASYELILSGPAQLSGPSTVNATAGATGANLANDTWGYAWEDTSVTDASASYKALASNIKLSVNALNNQAASFSRKLAFAAKFSENSNAGVYHADVSLSLVATPQITTTTINAVSWDRMVYMQDMNTYACESVPIGTSKTLTDTRDNSTYTVAKLSDGKCWMTQNLRLSRDTMKSRLYGKVIPEDTNINTNCYLPTSTTGGFDDTRAGNLYGNQEIRSATDADYGAYYSYNAATANIAFAQTSGTVQYDVCPKGWRLPTGGNSGEFQTLYDRGKSGWTTNNGKNGYWLGGTADSVGATFFPAASSVSVGGLNTTGSFGRYWSATIFNASSANLVSFDKNNINPTGSDARFLGHSIRCVAK